MKTLPLCSVVALVLGIVTAGTANAALTHRYSFNEPAGTTQVTDSVGGANGTLVGTASLPGDGQVLLNGTEGYVDLPAGLITGYPAVTFEVWLSCTDNGNWSRVLDFGDQNPNSGAGRFYVGLIAHSGGGDTRLTISDTDPGYLSEQMVIRPGVLDNLGKVHVAGVIDSSTGLMALYVNGALASIRQDVTIPLSSVNNAFSYLGKSLYEPDAYLSGSIDEFRIYDRALSPMEVAASAAAGPDNPSLDPGALQSIALQVDSLIMLNGIGQATVLANYEKISGVVLAGVAGVVLESSDTNVVTVSTGGLVTGVGLGLATVTATYGGKQATQTVVVAQPSPVLKHRYSFSEPPGSGAVDDTIGQADGTVVWGNSQSDFTGAGKLNLDGTDGYVDLPNGIISALTNATFEAWVTWNGNRMWERVFDFGNNVNGEDGQGTGTTYLFLTPLGGSGVVRYGITVTGGGAGEQMLNGPSALLAGQETHLAVSYNYSARVAKLYVNGQLVATEAVDIPLKNIADVNNWLGRSNWPDPYLDGLLNEFRIWEGALTDFEVAVSAAAGPDNPRIEAGALQGIRLQMESSLVHGSVAMATVLGDYAQVSGVVLSGLVDITYESSKTSVLVVSTNGQVTAVGLGTATITAKYAGLQASKDVKVVQAPAVLKHRYNFDDAPGSATVRDSVGGIDGTLRGGAQLDGAGRLDLDGVDGYVDLPNGIISVMTNATFEAWVTWNSPSVWWQRVFDFGNSTNGEDQQGNGTTYLFLTTRGGAGVTRFGITVSGGGAGEQVLNAPSALAADREAHLVVVYNYSARQAKLFVNGRLVDTRSVSIFLPNIRDVNNWLGRSQFVADACFDGQLNEFRIYNGALTDFEVALSNAAGPDRVGATPGPLSSLTLLAGTNTMVLGAVQPITAVADYASVTNVNVTVHPDLVYQSGNANVVLVSTNGVLDAVGLGTATVSATFQGKQASLTVDVVGAPGVPEKAELIHRYSFSEAAGARTVKDSVGGADGAFVGGGAFNGTGKLRLYGSSGYVNLPNGLVSGLTNVSFEAWVTWMGTAMWERIFDIGNNVNGEGGQGTGTTYLFLSPLGGANVVRFGITITGGGAGEQLLDGRAALTRNQEVHVAVSYNRTAGTARLYVNGQRVAAGPINIDLSSIEDVNVWLGRSNWPDPYLNGWLNEFRVYNGGLLDADVAASFASGPDALPGEIKRPTISVGRVGADVVLTWPATATGFILESAPRLGDAAAWGPAGLNVVDADGMKKVVISAPTGTQFFRLKR
jgi:uncharacterized protein YjdB